jgi:lipoprotein-releasing system ATP-binding protein
MRSQRILAKSGNEIETLDPSKVKSKMSSFLEIKNITKSFGAPLGEHENVLFSNLNLKIDAGSHYALVGPSGSGKSTLLNLISGLDTPTAGEVWVDGQKVHQMAPDKAAKFRNQTIGFIFQAHHLLPALTAQENVMVPALAGHGGLKGKALRDRAFQLLEQVGLADRAFHLPGQLSGGENQRVAVARSLMNDPPLLLADEPTGALDQSNAESLFQLLIHLGHEHNTTMLVVTHSQFLAQKMDKIYSFESGELTHLSS